ncbi:MAG TPA: DUF4190 domain-containing protein [Acidimicrobiia bacterium]|nr:DUF4190 domain-containing protein [Acidimicrobiia bacterium]
MSDATSEDGGVGWAAPSRTCPRCGAASRGGAFCAACGAPLDGQPPAPPAPAAPAWSPPGATAAGGYVPPPPGAYLPPPTGGYVPPGVPPYATPPTTGTNGLAIASLVLGLVWVCGIGSVLAVIFGVVALGQIKQRSQSGRGLAIAGIVLGALGIALIVVSLIAAAVTGDDEASVDLDFGRVLGDAREYGDDAYLDGLWDDCADGDMSDCDTLYFESPVDSAYERFGATCGGRSSAELDGRCDTAF